MSLLLPEELRTPQEVYLAWLETSRSEFSANMCDDLIPVLNGHVLVVKDGWMVNHLQIQNVLDVGAQA